MKIEDQNRALTQTPLGTPGTSGYRIPCKIPESVLTERLNTPIKIEEKSSKKLRNLKKEK